MKADSDLGDIMSELTAATTPAANILPPMCVVKRKKGPAPRTPNPFSGVSVKKRKVAHVLRAPPPPTARVEGFNEVGEEVEIVEGSQEDVGEQDGGSDAKVDDVIEQVESQVRGEIFIFTP